MRGADLYARSRADPKARGFDCFPERFPVLKVGAKCFLHEES